MDQRQEVDYVRLEVDVPHVADLEHAPDDLDSSQFLGRHMHSELELCPLVSVLRVSVSRAPLPTSRLRLEASIGLACLDVQLLEGIIGLWPLYQVQLILILVHEEEHSPDGQESVQVYVFNQIRLSKDDLLEEGNHKGGADPLRLQNDASQPAIEQVLVARDLVGRLARQQNIAGRGQLLG